MNKILTLTIAFLFAGALEACSARVHNKTNKTITAEIHYAPMGTSQPITIKTGEIKSSPNVPSRFKAVRITIDTESQDFEVPFDHDCTPTVTVTSVQGQIKAEIE
jgi:hypothetical protein